MGGTGFIFKSFHLVFKEHVLLKAITFKIIFVLTMQSNLQKCVQKGEVYATIA